MNGSFKVIAINRQGASALAIVTNHDQSSIDHYWKTITSTNRFESSTIIRPFIMVGSTIGSIDR